MKLKVRVWLICLAVCGSILAFYLPVPSLPFSSPQADLPETPASIAGFQGTASPNPGQMAGLDSTPKAVMSVNALSTLPFSEFDIPPKPNPVVWLFPDSEVVYSPSAANFDVAEYLVQAGGFLHTHREYLRSTAWTSAADIITRVALENSINPRLLLSLLEYHCGCVSGPLNESTQVDYLLGNTDFRRKGLFLQLSWAASKLSAGYYGQRGETLTGILISDPDHGDIIIDLAPDMNPGTVALQYFFAAYRDYKTWKTSLHPDAGLPALHAQLFGDPWKRAEQVEPLLPPGLKQVPLILPFEPGRLWSYTSGPHMVWEDEGAMAALDFAPATHESGCIQSDAWVVAMADGVIVRAKFGAVIQDLAGADGTPADGLEQTGWALYYMHVEERDRVAPGTYLHTGERIGHPSCEGGRSTGTHLHIAQKYNGEWLLAGGSLPYNLEGWIAQAGEKPYEGTLTRGAQIVIAHPYGSYETKIIRPTPAP